MGDDKFFLVGLHFFTPLNQYDEEFFSLIQTKQQNVENKNSTQDFCLVL